MIEIGGIKFNLRMATAFALSFAIGIILAVKVFSFPFYILFFFLSLFVALFYFILTKKRILLLILAITLGIGLGNLFTENVIQTWNAEKNFTGEVSASVVYVKERNGKFEVHLDKINLDGRRINGKGSIYLEREVYVGNEITFYGNLRETKVVSGGKVNTYLVSNSLKYSMYGVSNLKLYAGEFDFKMGVKEIARETFYENMNEDMAGLSYAMMFGDTDGIGDNVEDLFRASGISHIFAVSGLHMGIFFMLLSKLLKYFNISKTTKTLLSLALSFTYGYICDFSPSTIRAFTMIAIYMLCDAFNVMRDRLATLSISMAVILFISPLDLFSVGFMLSFLAMVGVIVLTPSLTRVFYQFKKLGKAFSLSLAVFITTFPVMAYFFSYVSIASPIANLIFIPVLTFCYVFNFIFLLPTALLGINFLVVTDIALKLVIALLEVLALIFRLSIPISLSLVSVLVIYLIILASSSLLFMRKRKRVIVISILFVLLIFSFSIAAFSNSLIAMLAK